MNGSTDIKDAGTPTLEGFFGYALRRATMRIEADLKKTLAPFGLRMVTFSALAVIHDNPGLSQNALAQRLSIESANLVAILDELEVARWIKRQISPSDRRSKVLVLTEDGKTLFLRAKKQVSIHDARMTSALSGPMKAQIANELRRIGKG